ncbi:Ig-like domain-containing protein [Pedobacter puniceum]|uniref:T9SS type A sorting domain-containing protein n=1 Tax=Pedobacter puniceum TaxID=2666136 RepID=A0A7K0FPB8_9SPHI|nr:Ig-like domain-containing protein [Pedobacter puniceum]MRX46897.1 T9SS type A sorting domain-containing protein [Pedobacter puniceum]
MIKRLLLCAIVGLQTMAYAQHWEIKHPGQGGQVQDIVLAKAKPGRIYVLSDVEGLYRSEDYGISYKSISEGIHNSMCFTLASDPQNAARVYLGTIRGVLYSDNGGDTWSPITHTINWQGTTGTAAQRGMPVATITVDPTNSDNVYFANSWKIKDGLSVWSAFGFSNAFNTTNADLYHTGRIWVSRNKGTTWTEVVFEPTSNYMNIHSITVNPANPAQIFVSAHTGLYVSNNYGAAGSWTKINTPTGAFFGRGMDISPDGAWIYACFTTENSPIAWRQSAPSGSRNPEATLYAARNIGTSFTWNNRGTGLGASSDANSREYAYPKVDPRSTSTSHTVLLGTAVGSCGLWENTFSISGSTISNPAWTQILWTSGKQQANGLGTFAYNPGWDTYDVTGRYYSYTPTNWPSRNIWTTGNQTMLQGNPAASGWPVSAASWSERYSEQISVTNNFRTYKHRGTASSINWDVDASGNYMVQAMSDNGIAESVDGGESWTRLNGPGVPNGQSCYIVKNISPKVVLAGAGTGFLGGTGTVNLHACKLDNANLTDSWMTNISRGISGGVSDISSDAVDGKKVYVATSTGLFYINNIYDLWNNSNNFSSILSGDIQRVIAHPTLANTVYVLTGNTIRKGTFSSGSWSFTSALATGAADFAVWRHNSRTYIAYVTGVAANPTASVSDDDGASFKQVFTASTHLPSHDWEDWLFIGSTKNITLKGIVGYQDAFYFGAGMRNNRKGMGYMKGSITGTGSALAVSWADWATENTNGSHHEFPWTERARIGDINGTPHILTATQGSGTWTRSLNQVPSNIAPTVSITSPSNNANFQSGTNITLNANANDTDGTITKVEFFQGTTKLGEDLNSPYTYQWNNVGTGTYQITAKATDNNGATTTSTPVNITFNQPAYRYLRLRGLSAVELDITIQDITWLTGTTAHPTNKLTSDNGTVVANVGTNAWKAYDTGLTTGWAIAQNFPAQITIDLGSGNEINPTAIRIDASAANRAFSAFECLGSNDNINFTLLGSFSGLTSSNYPSSIGNFSFSSGFMAIRNFSPELQENTFTETVIVYPNPSSGDLNTIISFAHEELAEIKLISLLGTTVWQQQKLIGKENNHLKINTQNLTSGVYFLTIQSSSKKITKKIIIQKP